MNSGESLRATIGTVLLGTLAMFILILYVLGVMLVLLACAPFYIVGWVKDARREDSRGSTKE